jgi:hypothetical protein
MKINLSINQAERAELQRINDLAVLGDQSPAYRLIEKVEEACVRANNPPINKQVKLLEKMTWYIAEVSYSSGNPIHRNIVFHRLGGNIEVVSNEDKDVYNITKLAYFKPIQKLTAMDDNCVSFMPKDAPAIVYIES